MGSDCDYPAAPVALIHSGPSPQRHPQMTVLVNGIATPRGRFLLPALLLIVCGCAASPIISQWSNPAYSEGRGGSPFRRVLVIGVSEQTAIRRNFEDRFVAALVEAGIDAVPSYRLFPESGKIAEARLKEAVEASRSDAAIITRLTHVERRTEVEPGFYDPYPAWRLYGWYSAAWHRGFYTPSRVYSYPIYYSETTLHDVAKDEVVWSGTLRTIDPSNAGAAIDSYIETVVRALRSSGILRH